MNASVGVLDIYELTDKSSDIVVLGKLKGTLKVGAAVYLSNVGDDGDSSAVTTVRGIEIAPNQPADEATDCPVGLLIEGGAKLNIRKGSVLFERETPSCDVRNAYINALGDEFIGRLKLNIPDKDMEKLTFADCVELWKLFRLYKEKIEPDKTEEEKNVSDERFSRLAQAVIDKLFSLKEIYCLVNKSTGEPHMLSSTFRSDNGSYQVSPPNILLFTKSQMPLISHIFQEDTYTYQLVDNTSDKNGIINFLKEAFYLNGACGVFLQDSEVSIDKDKLVMPLDESCDNNSIYQSINPGLERWLLLIGQLGTPDSPEKETIYDIYYRFMAREIIKTDFLVPVKNKRYATIKGKDGKEAVKIYTDLKRLLMGVGEEYEVQHISISELITAYDCAINVTEYLNAGCYINSDTYADILAMTK